jgi:lipoprotein signal peptidase
MNMAERSFRGLLWVLAVLGAVADQGTKYGVFAWLYEPVRVKGPYTGEYTVVSGVFELIAEFPGPTDPGNTLLSPLCSWGGEKLPRVNPGALFGMRVGRLLGLPDDGGILDNRVFAVISFLAAGLIIFWSTRPSLARDGLLCCALGLILGGTLGNCYDRIVFGGVRDFLHLHWYKAFDWPVFNVADCCLVSGALLLLLQALWQRPAPVAEAAGTLAAGSSQAASTSS